MKEMKELVGRGDSAAGNVSVCRSATETARHPVIKVLPGRIQVPSSITSTSSHVLTVEISSHDGFYGYLVAYEV